MTPLDQATKTQKTGQRERPTKNKTHEDNNNNS